MPSECISFRDTNYFSSLICDYLGQKKELQPLYNRFPNLDNFQNQIDEKSKNVQDGSRAILAETLLSQYNGIQMSSSTRQNIDELKSKNTFTITTGHQLNLFTGPLYFLYKIVSAINLTKELKQKYPGNNFVPIYWMASEDHDFEEINYFNLKGKKIQWTRDTSGAVGRLNLNGLEEIFKVLALELGQGENADKLKELFKKAYLQQDNLADATRYVANELFADFGLVILDGDDVAFKQLFVPKIKNELQEKTAYKNVSKTNDQISALSYKIQVNPRDINLFYIKENLRERIIKVKNRFQVKDSDISWSKNEILEEVHNHPERFSPNAIMRPLYQEVILPNLCYIGGGGELAYWLQLKEYFKAVDVTFPMLLLRNSVLVKTKKQSIKLEKLGLTTESLFLKQNKLTSIMTKQFSKIDIDFSPQKEHLKNQFESLFKLAEETDKSFLGAVGAQEKKQLKGLDHLEKRLLKAQKRKLVHQLERVTEIQNELFPNQSLQERQTNFSEFYLDFGDQLIEQLALNLQPLKSEFVILKI